MIARAAAVFFSEYRQQANPRLSVPSLSAGLTATDIPLAIRFSPFSSHEQQESRTVLNMIFQRLIIAVTDGKTLIVPDFPSGFVQRFDDAKYRVPVFMGITDKDIWFFLIRQEWGRQPSGFRSDGIK